MSLRRVLIVEDHVVVAEGLVRLLGDCFDVIGIVVDGRVAVDAIAHLRPDVVLLDLTMPKISGLDVLRLVAERGVETNAIVLTMHADPQLALEALKAGAHGFVMKESSTEELLAAIGVVLNGGTYIASALTKDVLSLMVNAGPAASSGADVAAARSASSGGAGAAGEGNRAEAGPDDAECGDDQVPTDAPARRPFDRPARPVRRRTPAGSVLNGVGAGMT